jgi:hypothetical protein
MTSDVARVIGALLIFLLPGLLLYRAPVAERSERARLSWEERLFWSVTLSMAWSLAVVLVLAWFGRYDLTRLLIVNALLSLILLVLFRSGLSYAGTAPGLRPSACAPAALVVLGVWLYFPSSEYVIGGRDPGTYINEGLQIAQRGSIVIHDPVVESVPPVFRDLFFPSHQEPWYYGIRFMGFFIQEPARGTVIGQFPHLYPASIAIGYGLNGLTGARHTSGAWAVFGLVAVYFVGARLFGVLPALAAALLLAVHVVQVWFARYPNAELVMQAFLFAALLAFARALEGGRRFFGPLAAVLVGLLLFLRYDAVLAFAGLIAAAVLAPVSRQRIGVPFFVALAACGAAGYWYLQGPMRAYSYYPLAFTREHGGAALIAAGLVGAFLAHRLLMRPRPAGLVQRWLPTILAAVLVGLAIYAYGFRQEGIGLAAADAAAFRTFAWYVSPWGLVAMVAATAWVVRRRFWEHPALFVTFSLFTIFFFYKTRIVPEHFWAARRFLAITLPAGMLFLAGAAADLAGERRWHRAIAGARWPDTRRSSVAALVGALAVLLLTPLAWHFWRASRPVRHHVEYAGLIPRLERLANQIGANDLLLVESRNASDLHVLAMPLAYIYARQLLVLDSPAPSKPLFEAFLDWADQRYDNVLFLGGGGSDLLTRRIRADSLGGDRFQVPEYDAPLNRYPEGVRRKEFEFGLYRFVTGERPAGKTLDLLIGVQDDLHVVRFHAREVRGEPAIPFRWTTSQSFVVLNGLEAAPRTVTVWMSDGGRPKTAAPPLVEVALADQPIGQVSPVDEILPYTFPIPPEIAERLTATDEPVRLRLRVATWNPAVSLGVADSRDLGVVVTRVEVR